MGILVCLKRREIWLFNNHRKIARNWVQS